MTKIVLGDENDRVLVTLGVLAVADRSISIALIPFLVTLRFVVSVAMMPILSPYSVRLDYDFIVSIGIGLSIYTKIGMLIINR